MWLSNFYLSQDENPFCDSAEHDIFIESMKHFNQEKSQQDGNNSRSKNDSPTNNHTSQNQHQQNQQQQQQQQQQRQHHHHHHHNSSPEADNNEVALAHQYFGQETSFGVDPSKQKFQYILAAPISIATKSTEDTMTYLNQAQAYEIKLENKTDVSEARKGFMCSIINIGFQERHMQQAENELWQQWSQEHPNDKIFSVDMKLSYNVFGVESDGLNKYEFLWDSSKVAGVFIRINSISTEFTPKKHGGEKGVPFKLSIETFSYNSKTHDSYFISAACCQIKVFKPKGAERKIRSDRDKIYKRPLIEQEKYHHSCDHTTFQDCSLTSLHPMANSFLSYYRHSHGQFASKQVSTSGTSNCGTSLSTHQAQQAEVNSAGHNSDNDDVLSGHHTVGSAAGSQLDNNTGPPSDTNISDHNRSNHSDDGSDIHDSDNHCHAADMEISPQRNNHKQLPDNSANYSTSRLIQDDNNSRDNLINQSNELGSHHNNYHPNTSEANTTFGSSSNEHNHHNHHHLPHLSGNSSSSTSLFNQSIYHHHQNHSTNHQQQVRSVAANLTGINNSQQHLSSHISYFGQPLPSSVNSHMAATNSSTTAGYSIPASSALAPALTHQVHHGSAQVGGSSFSTQAASHPHLGIKNAAASSIYKQLSGNHDNKPLINPIIHSVPTAIKNYGTSGLKGSNLGLVGNNYPSYFNHAGQDNCINTDNSMQHDNHQKQDPNHVVMTPISNNGGYNNPINDSYDSHLSIHHFGSINSHNQSSGQFHSTIRQRSASTSLTTPNIHCQSYLNSQNRHSDNYFTPVNSNDATSNNNNSNHHQTWNNNNTSSINNHQGNQQSRMTSPTHRDNNSNVISHNQNQSDIFHHHNNNSNFDCDSDHFDSDAISSPYKKYIQTIYPSTSCCSRFKSNPSANTLTCSTQPVHVREAIKTYNTNYTPHITINSSCLEVVSWFNANRFGIFAKTFNNFSGSDLLRLSKTELIEICGFIDGIRLYNCLHNQPIKPRRVLYVCHEDEDIFHPIYLYDLKLEEFLNELSKVFASHIDSLNGSQQEVGNQNKILNDRTATSSSSSTDSRSSSQALSTETNNEEVYHNEQFFETNNNSVQNKTPSEDLNASFDTSCIATRTANKINRLLIDGVASVRVVANEKVIELLEDESVWTIRIQIRNPGIVEACITACRSNKRPSR